MYTQPVASIEARSSGALRQFHEFHEFQAAASAGDGGAAAPGPAGSSASLAAWENGKPMIKYGKYGDFKREIQEIRIQFELYKLLYDV